MNRAFLYHCQYDISSPDGPGTNELEFTRQLAAHFGKNAWCVLPKPANRVPHLEQMNVIYCDPTPRLRELPGHVLRTISLARRIAGLIHEHRMNFVAVRLSSFPLLPFLLQRVHKVPIAVKTLGEWWPPFAPKNMLERCVNGCFNALVRTVIRHAAAVDTGLTILLERLDELDVPAERKTLIPNAANVDMFHPDAAAPRSHTLPESGPVLGYLGSLPSRRGAREMLHAAARLADDFPGLSVIIAGWDDGMPETIRLAERLGIADRCSFPGWIPYEDAPGTICAFDVAFSFFEQESIGTIGNCSQKVRQYLACGKPVISIRQGHEFLEENDLGSVVDPADIAQVEQAVRSWLAPARLGSSAVRDHIRDYAVKHLSTARTFADRLLFWETLFSPSKER